MSESKPVAWRAWAKDVPSKKWPANQWVYWDEEEPTTIQDDPEFEKFQALYTSPPLQQAVDMEEGEAIDINKISFAVAHECLKHLELLPINCLKNNHLFCLRDIIKRHLYEHLVSPREGSSKCPICELAIPHHHEPEVVAQHYEKVKSASLNQISKYIADFGLVMVPRESTKEMEELATKCGAKSTFTAARIWEAMVSVAASPPLAPTVGEK